ncbi:carboxylate-amine ligase [Streptacidiphilus sp. PAMC 29251]
MVTIGVEEEYLLLDPDSGLPVARSVQVRSAADLMGSLGGDEEVEPELLQAQVEVGTPVSETLDEVGAHLTRLRDAVRRAADGTGCRMAVCGAAPLRSARPVPVTDKARYQAMSGDAPQVVDEMLINGMHVHVAVPDPEHGVAALNRIRRWLPVLVALGANSPFWDGGDTGFASWRTLLFDRWPVSGPPPAFADAADYERRTQALLDAGAIRDRGQLYWQARLSARYPTIEIRALDVQLDIEDAVTLAGIVRGLVVQALHEYDADEPFVDGQLVDDQLVDDPTELIGAAVWQAARYGVEERLIDPRTGRPEPARDVVAALLEHIAPALKESGDLDRVRAGMERLLVKGTAAQRQRRAFQQGGIEAVTRLLTGTSLAGESA